MYIQIVKWCTTFSETFLWKRKKYDRGGRFKFKIHALFYIDDSWTVFHRCALCFWAQCFIWLLLADVHGTLTSATPQSGLRLLAGRRCLVDMWPIHFQQTQCRLLFHMLCQNEILFFLHFSFIKQTSEALYHVLLSIHLIHPRKKQNELFKHKDLYSTSICQQCSKCSYWHRIPGSN